jgi:mRNA interferase RelE/StbE
LTRYRLLVSRQVDRFLSRLDSRTRTRIIEDIADLENFPLFTIHHDLEKLKGGVDYYRLRIGDYRVVFKLNKELNVVYVE